MSGRVASSAVRDGDWSAECEAEKRGRGRGRGNVISNNRKARKSGIKDIHSAKRCQFNDLNQSADDRAKWLNCALSPFEHYCLFQQINYSGRLRARTSLSWLSAAVRRGLFICMILRAREARVCTEAIRSFCEFFFFSRSAIGTGTEYASAVRFLQTISPRTKMRMRSRASASRRIERGSKLSAESAK